MRSLLSTFRKQKYPTLEVCCLVYSHFNEIGFFISKNTRTCVYRFQTRLKTFPQTQPAYSCMIWNTTVTRVVIFQKRDKLPVIKMVFFIWSTPKLKSQFEKCCHGKTVFIVIDLFYISYKMTFDLKYVLLIFTDRYFHSKLPTPWSRG